MAMLIEMMANQTQNLVTSDKAYNWLGEKLKVE